ncbi:uncharacterized protein LOC144421917 [Styela clava]
MGNSHTKTKKRLTLRDDLWKTKILGERHLQAIAIMLTRSPEYLGSVALGFTQEEIDQIIMAQLQSKSRFQENDFTQIQSFLMQMSEQVEEIFPNTSDKFNKENFEDGLKKFKLLMEWKRQCREPTAEILSDILTKSGFEENSYIYILKHGMGRPSILKDINKHRKSETFQIDNKNVERSQSIETHDSIGTFSSFDTARFDSNSSFPNSDAVSTQAESINSISINSSTQHNKARRRTVEFDLGNEIKEEDENDMIEIVDASTQTDFLFQSMDDNSLVKQKSKPVAKFVKTISFDSDVSIAEFH